MKPGFICVAGLDKEGRHVRPVLRSGQLSAGLLRSRGGALDIGAVVELGEVQPIGRPPELEDGLFDPAVARLVRMEKPSAFWGRVEAVARPSLKALFGSDLELEGTSATVKPGRGTASLGVLVPHGRPELEINRFGDLRLRLSDGKMNLNLRLTDFRFYEDDWKTPNKSAVKEASEALKLADALVCVGLGRPWKERPPARHWLQANNLVLRP